MVFSSVGITKEFIRKLIHLGQDTQVLTQIVKKCIRWLMEHRLRKNDQLSSQYQQHSQTYHLDGSQKRTVDKIRNNGIRVLQLYHG